MNKIKLTPKLNQLRIQELLMLTDMVVSGSKMHVYTPGT